MSTVMWMPDAEVVAARTLAAIDDMNPVGVDRTSWVFEADRERVKSDRAGLLQHNDYDSKCAAGCGPFGAVPECLDAQRYSDGLRRTAALYGVAP